MREKREHGKEDNYLITISIIYAFV